MLEDQVRDQVGCSAASQWPKCREAPVPHRAHAEPSSVGSSAFWSSGSLLPAADLIARLIFKHLEQILAAQTASKARFRECGCTSGQIMNLLFERVLSIPIVIKIVDFDSITENIKVCTFRMSGKITNFCRRLPAGAN